MPDPTWVAQGPISPVRPPNRIAIWLDLTKECCTLMSPVDALCGIDRQIRTLRTECGEIVGIVKHRR